MQPATANSVLLKASKHLRLTGKIMICLNAVFAVIFSVENIHILRETPPSWIGIAVCIFVFLLIFTTTFLCYYYIKSIPNDEESTAIYKQSHHSTPIVLLILLSVQIAIIASTYMFDNMGWHTFESFRLIYFISPPVYPAILMFFLQIAIVINAIYLISRFFKFKLLYQNYKGKKLLLHKQANQYYLYLKIVCIVAIFSTMLYLVYNIYTEATMFQYFDFVLINPISFKEVFFILNLIIPIVLSIAIWQKFHIDEPPKFKRLCERLTLFISMSLVYYFIASIPKELLLNRYLLLAIALLATISQITLLYTTYRIQITIEISDLLNKSAS